VGSYSVESNLVKFGDIPSFKEVVINGGCMEVVRYPIDENELSPKSSVLNFLKESIVESGNIGS
jgi:hypothetical protein